jgi:hypothetical protein
MSHQGNDGNILRSSFVQDAGLVNMHLNTRPADKIMFKRTVCTIKPDSGSYSLSESATIETGFLDQAPMVLSVADQGKTKDVYQVRHQLHISFTIHCFQFSL